MDAHLAKTVLWAVLAVHLCLLTVVTLFTAMDEMRDAKSGYTAWHAALYVLHTTPRRISELTPYAVFVGVLAGLGLLARNGEITVLRAAGVSVARLFASVAAAGLVALVASLAIGEFAAPWGEQRAAAIKSRSGEGDQTTTNTWLRRGGLFTNVGGYDDQGRLVNVRQFVLENGRLRTSRHAEHAALGGEEGAWLLRNVAQTNLGGRATRVTRPAALLWRSDLAPALLTAKAAVDPAKLSLADLRLGIDQLRREGLSTTRHQVFFWSKALQPAAVLGLVLVAVGFVLGPLREVGMGTRLCVGVAVGLAFKYLVDVFGPMSIVFAIPPWLAMSAPVAVCWLAGAMLIRRL